MIRKPDEGSRWQRQETPQVIRNGAPMRSKWAICYQCLYILAASAPHNGDRGAHRISHHSQSRMRCSLLRIGHRPKKIVDFAIAEGHRFPNHCAMPIILKGQDVMAGLPKMSG